MVFMALTTPGENKYIPFKDSKLTRLLKDSLGGNAVTTLLCTYNIFNIALQRKRDMQKIL
jgi:hypothetical protein